jgi:hypothetical protein
MLHPLLLCVLRFHQREALPASTQEDTNPLQVEILGAVYADFTSASTQEDTLLLSKDLPAAALPMLMSTFYSRGHLTPLQDVVGVEGTLDRQLLLKGALLPLQFSGQVL